MPPALRKSSSREVLRLLRANGQFGFPPSTQTDTCLRFRRMGRQSSEVAINHCDAPWRILFRLEGLIARGHDASEQNWAQETKVGYCPCCTRAPYIALPPAYTVGVYSSVEEQGTSPWSEAGPRAGRRLVA